MIEVCSLKEDDLQSVRDFYRQKGMNFSGIQLRYDRGPDFRSLLKLQAPRIQTILAKESEEIRTMVSITSGPRWLNGKIQEVGFLSDFRIDGSRSSSKAWRSCLSKAIQIFKQEIAPAELHSLFAVILKDNKNAIQSLVKDRRHLDYSFTEVASVSMINIFARLKRFPVKADWRVERLGASSENELVEFLDQRERERQIGYVIKSNPHNEYEYRKTHWGFDPENFLVIRSSGKIVACTLPWAAQPDMKKMYFSDAPWLLEAGLKFLKYLGKPAILRNEPIKTLYLTHFHVQNGFDKSQILQLFLNHIYSARVNKDFHMVSFADWWNLSEEPGLLKNTYHQKIPVGIYSVHNKIEKLKPEFEGQRIFNFEMAVI